MPGKVTTNGNGARRRARKSGKNVERAFSVLSVLRSMPRSHSYPALGAVLALGAPLGLFIVEALAAGQVPTFAWALEDIARLPVTYAYVTLSTVVVLTILGYVLGRWFDRARRLSITDPLTGLFNRRHFGQRLMEEIRRRRRYERAGCVVFLHIVRHKANNDGFGHKAGDHALLAVCQILLKNVRAIDAVARVGGDEFAVLLPETSAAQASALSQRILTEVARYSDALTGNLAVSISIGIAELNATADVEVEDVLAAADAALYRAKAAGGGRVAIAQRSAGANGVARPTLDTGGSSAAQRRPDTLWSVQVTLSPGIMNRNVPIVPLNIVNVVNVTVGGADRLLVGEAAPVPVKSGVRRLPERSTEDDRLSTLGELLALSRAPELRGCSVCRRIATQVCGDSLIEQSWFRLAPGAGLCSVCLGGGRGDHNLDSRAQH